jgi:coenzyme F420-reducing hydrogenase delta subunit
MGCGICVAACPLGAIARPGVSNQEIVEQIPTPQANGKPSLVVFVCDWCLRSAADVSLLEAYPENVHVIHIPCSGRIDPQMALLALQADIDGVLVCGCEPGECHYQRGNYVSTCKLGVLGRMLDQMSVGNGRPTSSRVRFVQIGTQDRGRIRYEMDHMLEHLAAQEEVQQ